MSLVHFLAAIAVVQTIGLVFTLLLIGGIGVHLSSSHRHLDEILSLLQLDATTEALKRLYGAEYSECVAALARDFPLPSARSLAWPAPVLSPWAAPDPSTACRTSNVWPAPTYPQQLAA